MRTRGLWIGAGMGIVGAGMTAWGNWHDVLYMIVGPVLMVLGAVLATACVVCSAIRLHLRPASDAYEQGHQAGFDKGWVEGRRSARPVVIDLDDRRGQAG
jgi:hypothetical protein